MGKMVFAFLLLWLFTPFDTSEGAAPGASGGWIDLMLVIDGSRSVGEKNFETVKKWIIDVAAGFHIAKRVQPGIVQFSNWDSTPGIIEQKWTKTEVRLDAYHDQEALAEAVRNITGSHRSYVKHTAHALEKTVLEDFNGSASRYPTARRVMVLLTGGNARDHNMLPSVVNLINRAGVTCYAVGVGHRTLKELHDITGSEERVIEVDDFGKLLQSVPEMQHLIRGAEENTTYFAESATVELAGVFHTSTTHPSMQGRSTSGTLLPDVVFSNLSPSTIIMLVSGIVLLLAAIAGIAAVFLYKRLKKSPSRNNQNPQTQEIPLQRADQWNSQSRLPGERLGQAVAPVLPEDPHIYEEMKRTRQPPEPPLPGMNETPGYEVAMNNRVLQRPAGEYAECQDPTTSQQNRIRNQNSRMLKQGSAGKATSQEVSDHDDIFPNVYDNVTPDLPNQEHDIIQRPPPESTEKLYCEPFKYL